MNALQLSPPEPNSSTSNGDQPPASRTRPWNIVAEEVFPRTRSYKAD